MTDTLTPILGLTKPSFDGPADVRVINSNFDILDAAAQTAPGRSNLLTNPGLEIWQRGSGPFAANGLPAADRWSLSIVAGTLSVTRDAANADAGSAFCAALAAGGSPNAYLVQKLEDYLQLRGRTITFAARVRASAVNAARVGLFDSVNGWTYSGYHSGSGAYETLTVTAAVPPASTGVTAAVNVVLAGTVYADAAVLAVGTVAPPYSPLHPADEWERCLRYYQEIGGLDPNEFVGSGYAVSTTGAQVIIRYVTEMALAPTVTISAGTDFEVGAANGNAIPCTALVVSTPSLTTRRECRLIATVAAGLVAGNATYLRAASTPSARVRLEANPP
jgi:hypothetical protein